MQDYTFIATVRADGRTSKKIAITKAVEALGLSPGDYVEVTLRRKEE